MHLRSASLVVTVGLLSAPGLLPVSAVIQQLTYTLPAQTQAEDFIVRIRDIEDHGGVDFFPMLRDDIEDLIKNATPVDLWGAQ